MTMAAPRRGPTLKSLLMLTDVPPAPRSAPLPAPPLQRFQKPIAKPVDTVLENDCVLSHLEQLTQSQAAAAQEAERIKSFQKAERRMLRARHAAAVEDRLAHRELRRQLDEMHTEQQQTATQRELADYASSYSPSEHWPYGRNRPGPPLSFGPEAEAFHADYLHEQKKYQQRTRDLRKAIEKAVPAEFSSPAQRRHPELPFVRMSKAEIKERSDQMREDVGKQAGLREKELLAQAAQAAGGSKAVIGQMRKLRDGAALRSALEKQNQQHLRQTLTLQMNEKKLRDVTDYRDIYGASAKRDTGTPEREQLSEERAAAALAQHKLQLEQQISQKWRERKQLKAVRQQRDADVAAKQA